MNENKNINVTEKNFVEWNESMVKKHGTILEYQDSGPVVRFIEGKRVKWVVQFVDAKNKDMVLDVGCGAGNILEKIKFGELFGVDISETLLATARTRMGGRATITHGNVEDMTKLFPHKSFTKIFSSEVIEHVLHPDIMISEIHDLIDKNGVFVISIPNERLIKAAKRVLIHTGLFKIILGKRDEERAEYDWHLHDFDLPKLKKLIEGKFTIGKTKSIPFWFLPLRYVVKMTPINK